MGRYLKLIAVFYLPNWTDTVLRIIILELKPYQSDYSCITALVF